MLFNFNVNGLDINTLVLYSFLISLNCIPLFMVCYFCSWKKLRRVFGLLLNFFIGLTIVLSMCLLQVYFYDFWYKSFIFAIPLLILVVVKAFFQMKYLLVK